MKKKAMDMALNRNLMGNVTYKTRYSVFPWNNNNRGGGDRDMNFDLRVSEYYANICRF